MIVNTTHKECKMTCLTRFIHFRKFILGHIILFFCIICPIWAFGAAPWVYVTNNRSDSMIIIESATRGRSKA